MTNKECKKAAEEYKEKADLINESVNWAADRAEFAFDRIEELEDCRSIDCEKKKTRYMKEANKYLNKLEHENSLLDKYGDDLKELMEKCACKSGHINF